MSPSAPSSLGCCWAPPRGSSARAASLLLPRNSFVLAVWGGGARLLFLTLGSSRVAVMQWKSLVL